MPGEKVLQMFQQQLAGEAKRIRVSRTPSVPGLKFTKCKTKSESLQFSSEAGSRPSKWVKIALLFLTDQSLRKMGPIQLHWDMWTRGENGVLCVNTLAGGLLTLVLFRSSFVSVVSSLCESCSLQMLSSSVSPANAWGCRRDKSGETEGVVHKSSPGFRGSPESTHSTPITHHLQVAHT